MLVAGPNFPSTAASYNPKSLKKFWIANRSSKVSLPKKFLTSFDCVSTFRLEKSLFLFEGSVTTFWALGARPALIKSFAKLCAPAPSQPTAKSKALIKNNALRISNSLCNYETTKIKYLVKPNNLLKLFAMKEKLVCPEPLCIENNLA